MVERARKGVKNTKKPRVLLRTFGCQMNARDSEFVMGILLERGFRKAAAIDKADVILFNSCSVRKHAEDRLFGNIGDLKDLKIKKPGLVIGVMGCTAQSLKAKALERAPLLDFVCGPGDEAALPEIIKDIIKNKYPIVATGRVNEKRPELFPEYRASGFKAYVSIGEGCNNYCSYCIVPYVRGRERSRDVKDILKEAGDLAARGFKEILLLGQNVNSYNGDRDTGFVKLLEELNAIKGITRIRFMTSHPKDATVDLFKAIANLEKVCEHLHLPMQSGSDRILKLMNRGYTKSKYVALAENYKRIVRGGSLTTDVIVGFPSETDKDFRDTMDVIKALKFDSAFTFKYSPRPPAKSAVLKDDITKEVKDERLKELMDVQAEISEKNNKKLVGNIMEVLVDGALDKTPSKLTGRTRTNKVAVFKGKSSRIGTIVNVKIESITPYALKGRIV